MAGLGNTEPVKLGSLSLIPYHHGQIRLEVNVRTQQLEFPPGGTVENYLIGLILGYLAVSTYLTSDSSCLPGIRIFLKNPLR